MTGIGASGSWLDDGLCWAKEIPLTASNVACSTNARDNPNRDLLSSVACQDCWMPTLAEEWMSNSWPFSRLALELGTEPGQREHAEPDGDHVFRKCDGEVGETASDGEEAAQAEAEEGSCDS